MQGLFGKFEHMLSFKRPKSSLKLNDQLAKQIKLNKQENSQISDYSQPLKSTTKANDFCLSQYQLYKEKLLRKKTNSEVFYPLNYSQTNKENACNDRMVQTNYKKCQGFDNTLNKLVNSLKTNSILQRQSNELQLISEMENQIQPKRLVEFDWVLKYKKFLQCQEGQSIKLQQIKQINNTKLLRKLNSNQNTVENQDYIKLNEITYKFLQKLYGGGPEIPEPETLNTIKRHHPSKTICNSLKLKPKGLENKGADCYLNATLQCLFSIEELNYYLGYKQYEQRRNKKPKQFCKILSEIIQGMSQNDQLIIITKLQQLIAKDFQPGVQQDCHELLIYLLDAISSELKIQQQQQSIIQELFEGETESQVQCLQCGNKSKIKEINLGLSVNNGGKVQECIEQFCSKEIIDEYQCDKCLKKGKAAKKTRLSKIPKILIIQIKKFDQMRKKYQNLEFSIDGTLDLQKVYSSNLGDAQYKLIAFVVHKGWIDFGHYYAYCKRFDQWFVFDDEYYTQIPKDHIDINHAYLLFYQKI